MWSALKSDLTEFVSTVTEDTTSALNQMDENFDEEDPSPEEQEVLRRIQLPETYTAPLKTAQEDEEEGAKVDAFLQDFSVESNTEDISRLLQENPDTLQKHMDELVPTTVSYEDFWQRYYYRCDAERISQEWEEEEEDDQGPGPMNKLGSLLGGAVKAVSASLAEDDDGVKLAAGEATGKSTAASFFQGARPPFVMNTAVSDDDEDEDEEELGWDDDDEEEEEEEETEEQIVFNDPEIEKLQEQLKQAQEERDQLQQTVHMQSKEITDIKNSDEVHTKDEVDQLKIQLFEKESELAAVKASKMDMSRVDSEDGDPVLAEMQNSLSDAQKRIDELSAVADSNKSTIGNLQSEKADLEAKLAGLESSTGTPSESDAKLSELGVTVQKLTTEKADLEQATQAAKAESEASLAQLQQQVTTANAEAAKAKSELGASAAEMDAAKQRADDFEKALKGTESTLQAKEELVAKLKEELVATRQSTSPDTPSTSVKVESPVSTKIPVSGNDEEEDEWGEDWGDDSETG